MAGIPSYPNDSGAAIADLGITHNSLLVIQREPMPATLNYAYGQGEAVPYATFKPRNGEYLGKTWARCRAFYKGGKYLLDNQQVMNDVFPQHLAEKARVYDERKRRAFYINYAGAIIDWFTSALASDPVVVGIPEEGDTESAAAESLEVPDEIWDDFFKDISKPGGEKCTFQQHMLGQLCTALQTRRVWTLVDFPEQAGEYPATLAEQDRAKGRRAYLVHVDPEEVIDWEADESGELNWAIRRTVDCPREDWRRGRSEIVERFTIYERDEWFRFEIRYPKNEPPDENARVYMVGRGVHSFPRVPLLPLVLPEGLWAMGKLESPVRAHFNKRNALDWAEHKSLLPVLYEFLGPDTGTADATENPGSNDPSRATNQVRGQGYVQERGHQDSAEFIGPDSGPFAAALASCHDLRDELHRIVHQMALAVNNTGAALGRSAESKGQDKADRTTILEELGRRLREYALRVVETVEAGMGEPKPADWRARGWESFDLASLTELIEQAVQISVLGIESPTFKRIHHADVVHKVLGEKATPEVMEAVEGELETAYAQDAEVKEAETDARIDLAENPPEPGAAKPGKPFGKP